MAYPPPYSYVPSGRTGIRSGSGSCSMVTSPSVYLGYDPSTGYGIWDCDSSGFELNIGLPYLWTPFGTFSEYMINFGLSTDIDGSGNQFTTGFVTVLTSVKSDGTLTFDSQRWGSGSLGPAPGNASWSYSYDIQELVYIPIVDTGNFVQSPWGSLVGSEGGCVTRS